MTSIFDAFPSKYVKHSDLKGRAVPATIEKVVFEDIGGEQLPVCYFNNGTKGLVINKTNAGEIADAYGEDYRTWGGKKIFLYPARTAFQGKMVDCIRVANKPAHLPPGLGNGKIDIPKTIEPDPASDMSGLDDEIPF